jgi:hypothetical protein
MAANQLLNRRYGINASKELSQNAELEWQVWLAVLGKLPPEFRAAALSMRTILGCGLAELAALYISPLLRNRYFITICAVFIAAWCIQSASYALRRHEPARRNITLLASLLVEMEEAEVVTAKGTSTYPKETSLLIDGEGEEG